MTYINKKNLNNFKFAEAKYWTLAPWLKTIALKQH